MIRDFSDETREEIHRLLYVIDDKELNSIVNWSENYLYEYCDFFDKLNVYSCINKAEDYFENIFNMNSIAREKIDFVFENVHEIDKRYQGLLRNYSEGVNLQRALLTEISKLFEKAENNNGSIDGEETIIQIILKISDKLKEINSNSNGFINFINGKTSKFDYDEYIKNVKDMYINGFMSEKDYIYFITMLNNHEQIPASAFEDVRKAMKIRYSQLVEINETLDLYVNEEVLKKIDWDIDDAKKVLGEDFISVLRKEMMENEITSEINIKSFLVTITVETEHGNKLLEDDYGDTNYFESRSLYDKNTRGAGLIHITGETQKAFIGYLLDNAEETDEKEKLQCLYDGYYFDGEKCRNNVYIDGLCASEYIAKNYPLESAIWYWSGTNICLMDGKYTTLEKFVDGHQACDEYVLFLASQYYVNGRQYGLETTDEMCNNSDNVIIQSFEDENGNLNWQVDYLGNVRPVPNGWNARIQYFNELGEIGK